MNLRNEKETFTIITIVKIISIIIALLFGILSCSNTSKVPKPNIIIENVVTTVNTSIMGTTTTTTTTTTTEATTKATTEATTATSILATTTAQTTQTKISQTTKPIITTTTTILPIIVEEYVIYKPVTHYIHKNTCRWATGDIKRIENTENIQARKCTECNPDMNIVTEYIEPVPEVGEMTYIKKFTRGTYYAYGGPRKGGSQRQLIDCSIGDGTVKGSIASSYLYRNYGYNYNGKRTMVYLEIEGYPSMTGYYYLDDCDAGNPNVIDFFFLYGSNCPFRRQGVVQVDCYIVNN